MLWDIIRDWFVMYVWGGCLSDGNTFYSGFIGMFNDDSFSYCSGYTDSIFINIGPVHNGGFDVINTSLSLGDWLSTTSTIIVLVAMCLFLFAVVRYLFRLTAGLIRGR